jgi:hypothetical protein
VHVGTRAAADAWRTLPLAAGSPLRLHDDGPAGVTGIDLAGIRPFALGELRLEAAS